MTTNKFTMHTDPGHGWLEVTMRQINAVGLTLDDFSEYSYRVSYVGPFFLEEDCDAAIFTRAWGKRHGRLFPFDELRIHDTPSNSKIRSLYPIR